MTRWMRRLKYWLGRRRIEAELAEELETHRALAQSQLEARGLAPADAARASRRNLGNVLVAREDARGVWIWPALERIGRDVRYAVRALRASPTFSLVAVLTLALGIGASTAAFSVVEAELLRPLPFPEPDRLVAVSGARDNSPTGAQAVSVPDYEALRTQNHTLDSLAASGNSDVRVLTARSSAERVNVINLTTNFPAVLGLAPALGRSFQPGDDREGSGHVAILSDACWRRLFAADPTVVGAPITLDGETYQVIGVASSTWHLEFLSDYDLFVPVTLDGPDAVDRSARKLWPIGRLKAASTIQTADLDLRAVSTRLAQDYPADDGGVHVRAQDLRSAYTGYNWRTLVFFLGAALVLLLVSCVNVGNLLLARALGRQREFAIRAALGGGRGALVRQLIVEGAALAAPAGALGVLLADWSVRAFVKFLPTNFLERGDRVALDTRVVAFAVMASALTAVIFGLAPAIFAWRVDLSTTLSQGSRGVAGLPAQRRTRRALVVAEISLALVLLFGAGLFANSFTRLSRMPLGFDHENRLTMRMVLTGPRYANPPDLIGFADRLTARVAAEPGVTSAVVANRVPLIGPRSVPFIVPGREKPAAGDEPTAILSSVMPAYFPALDIRLLAGRGFDGSDVEGAPRVALINEVLARRIFPAENPIGKTLTIVPSSLPVTPGTVQIVGVVQHTKEVGLNEVDFNDLYVPFAQNPTRSIFLIARTSSPATSLTPAIRHDVLELDKDLPVFGISTMAQRLDDSLRGDRFNMTIIAAFAGLAVVLACVGIYGALSYATEQRTREFGVRMALGAPRSRILSLAIADAATLGLVGLGVGVAVALGLGRLLGTSLYLVERQHEGMLYGVTLFDPLTLGCACSVLFGAALLAGFVPARRASRVDPLIALRDG